MVLHDSEITKIAILWQYHRNKCEVRGAVHIAQHSSGIGIVTEAICPCGQVLDMTDYYAW